MARVRAPAEAGAVTRLETVGDDVGAALPAPQRELDRGIVAVDQGVQAGGGSVLSHPIGLTGDSALPTFAAVVSMTAGTMFLVWLGELTAALPEAKAAAISPSTSTYTRIAAIRAVRSGRGW